MRSSQRLCEACRGNTNCGFCWRCLHKSGPFARGGKPAMCQVSDFTEAAQWDAHLLDNQASHAVGNENDGRLVPVSAGLSHSKHTSSHLHSHSFLNSASCTDPPKEPDQNRAWSKSSAATSSSPSRSQSCGCERVGSRPRTAAILSARRWKGPRWRSTTFSSHR